MHNFKDLILQMKDLYDFLESLNDIEADVLLCPMVEGKWSVQETIAHIMTYDEVFIQSAVIPILNGKQPHIPDPAYNQSFNDKSAALGRTLTKTQLLERAKNARERLMDNLQQLPIETLKVKYIELSDDSLTDIIERDFVLHERSHIEKMKRYLESTREQ